MPLKLEIERPLQTSFALSPGNSLPRLAPAPENTHSFSGAGVILGALVPGDGVNLVAQRCWGRGEAGEG